MYLKCKTTFSVVTNIILCSAFQIEHQWFSTRSPTSPSSRERRAAARQAAAEEAEAILSLEEKDVLDMAETAQADQVAEQAEDTTDDDEEVTIIEVVQTSVEEINDEVATDSEYESMTPSKDDPQPNQAQLKNLPQQYKTALWVVKITTH